MQRRAIYTNNNNDETCRRWQRRMLSYRSPNRVVGENIRSSPSHHRKNSSRRYNNRRNIKGHSTSHQARHGAPQQLQYGYAGGTQGGGPPANSLAVFQTQQGVPPAPSSGTHAPGIRYGPTPNTNPTDASRGLSAPTEYQTAVHLNFPSLQ